jgi:carbamoyltransferase
LLYLIQRLRDLSSSENLCYAGGVALNSIANERIIRESGFKNVYIMPAAEDSGPAIGAAYYGLWQLTEHNSVRKMVHDACGRLYSLHSSLSALERHQDFKVARSTDVISDTVDLLCDRKIIGGLLGGRSLGQELWGSGAYFATRAALKLKQS